MRSVLAGDLGGTKCRLALVDEELVVHAAVRISTPRERAAFLAALEGGTRDVLAAKPPSLEPPAAIGLGVAALVSADGRSLRDAPNLPIEGFPLGEHLERSYEMPVTLLNDGRASAWGEFARGRAKGEDPLLCLFFGTGIGIGLMVGGRPYTGAGNVAGEIGHTIFRSGGRVCSCGRRGHFEAYCGGRAITERALAELGAPKGSEWTVAGVVARAEEGNLAARAILAEAAEAASALLVNACTLLDPAAVVLGGGALEGWPALRSILEEAVEREAREPVREGLRIVPSLGGSDAILQGAAIAAGVQPD